jgi:hypothetical protein
MRIEARLLGALCLAFAFACSAPPAPPPATAPPPPATAGAVRAAPDALPETPEEAESLRGRGVAWDNAAIRDHYLRLVGRIHDANERWKQEGQSAEQRARSAYRMRSLARSTCRAMMSDRAEVEALRARDREKYGDPDGPRFEALVERERKKGLEGDAVFEAIVASAQRTDSATNEMLGVKPRSP